MSTDVDAFVRFLEEQKARQAPYFPTVKSEKVLSFMGTTSLAGTHAAVAVNRVVGFEPAGGGRELRIALGGALARRPETGECVTVHITRLEQYQGYQVKTKSLQATTPEAELLEARPGGVLVKGAHVFTVHHSPYTLKFFESVPYEELEETIGGIRFALTAVGETANLSPRFVFHHEVSGGKVVLFHGDGLALKTYMNLKSNRQESRLVLDLETFAGHVLRGTVEEFQPHQFPVAYERICQGFTSGGWGKPSRVFRFVADRIDPIAPPPA